MALILRQTKGAPLTYGELDGNLTYLSESYAGLSGSNTFNGNQTIVGNLNVFGSASFTYVTSSTNEISSSTFGITISTPTIRYGLYNVYDVGSTKTTASFAWDSTNSYWLYQKVTGSVTSSAIFLTGPKGTGGLGTEANIPQYRVPMSNGDQSLVNSNIFTSGSFNTITGSTLIYSFASYSTPTLGTGSGGFFLGGDSGFYGLYMGVSSSGTTWIQSNRNDGLGLAYNIALQPVGGNVNIGKFNPATTGPKLDISGSTLLTGSLDILGNTVITGSLIVTGGITATASYASNANSSSFALTSTSASNARTASFYDGSVTSSSFASTASYVLNAVSSSFAATSISSSFATTSSLTSQAISASFATTASYILNAVSSSFATTASFLRPLSQSVVNTGSLVTRNTATTTTFAAIGRSGSLYIDLSGVGLNYIDGNALFIRNSAGTTNLVTVSGSKFMVSAPTELSGSLSMRRADGDVALFVSSSVSSSTSTSVVGTTASFDSTIAFTPGGSNTTTWDTNLDIYYSGNSGSGHTNLSPVSSQAADNVAYSTFTIVLNDGAGTGISLTPSGSIPSNKYTIWIYASGSINKWFEKIDNDISILKSSGLTININGGNTNTQLESDLISTGFAETSDPNPYTNNITTILTISSSFTSSLMNVKGATIITGSLNVSGSTSFVGTHTLSGSNTIIGDTVMSGSIIISGSTTFRNSIFTVTGSQFYTGSSDFKGSQTITGSLRLTSNGIGTGLFINGQKQFNYISLFHTASILPTQNVSGSFIYSSQITSSGISVVSGSRITFANTGTYNIQFSTQMYTPTNNTNVYIWFKKNGTNIANSATQIDIGTSDYGVAAWNFVDTFTSGSYAEIVYQTDQNNVQFQYSASSGNIPAIPSIIATVTQVA
jgi:hypothetical protein